MAIIRTINNHGNNLNYVGTLSFLCAISCTIIMLKFRRFRANFNISKVKESNLLHYNDSPGVSLTGAYRTNKDELFGTTNYPNPPKKITPSMVTLPASQTGHRKEISKSTSNLAQPLNENINRTKSTPNIPQVVPAPLTRIQIKEQKKLEKKHLDEQQKQIDEQKKLEKKNLDEQKKLEKKNLDEQKKSEKKNLDEQKKHLDEQKKLEKKHSDEQKKHLDEQKKQAKLAAKEQEKEKDRTEQLRKEREKQIQKTKAEEKKKSKRAQQQQHQPQAENVRASFEVTTRPERPESTNTLESSISRSSGPPPYSPKEEINIVNNSSDPSGNTSFSDKSSWNMITQHRLEINRPVVVKSIPKQTHLDLHYNAGPTDARDNTNA